MFLAWCVTLAFLHRGMGEGCEDLRVCARTPSTETLKKMRQLFREACGEPIAAGSPRNLRNVHASCVVIRTLELFSTNSAISRAANARRVRPFRVFQKLRATKVKRYGGGRSGSMAPPQDRRLHIKAQTYDTFSSLGHGTCG